MQSNICFCFIQINLISGNYLTSHGSSYYLPITTLKKTHLTSYEAGILGNLTSGKYRSIFHKQSVCVPVNGLGAEGKEFSHKVNCVEIMMTSITCTIFTILLIKIKSYFLTFFVPCNEPYVVSYSPPYAPSYMSYVIGYSSHSPIYMSYLIRYSSYSPINMSYVFGYSSYISKHVICDWLFFTLTNQRHVLSTILQMYPSTCHFFIVLIHQFTCYI